MLGRRKTVTPYVGVPGNIRKQAVNKKKMKFSFCACLRQSLLFFLGLILVFTLGIPRTHSADITLAWAPNNETNLAGYKVFCRESGERYDYNDPIWEADETETSCTVYGLGDSTSYCFVVRAFDTSGNESGNSNEACWQYSPPLATLESLSISGPDSVSEAITASYSTTARFSDGTSQPVTNSSNWSENSSYASITGSGVLTTSLVPSEQTVTITASYTFEGVTKTAFKVVAIEPMSTTLESLSISGPDSVSEGSTASYSATARFIDGTSQPATNSSNWSENSSYASLSGSGLLTTSSVPSNQTVTITARYTFANVTRTAQKTVTIADISGSNRPPQQPIIISPYHGEADVSLTPELSTGQFYDPDGDAHGRTRWQISSRPGDFSEGFLVLGVDTDFYLTSLIVPRSVLDEETTYYWRVRFYDSKNSGSEWSDICSFRTLFSGHDVDPRNGIPDDQEVDGTLDLDHHGTADINQGDIKCVNTVVGDQQIGVKAGQNVVSIVSLKSIDPESLPGTSERPDEMPFGAISFKLSVANPGDSAEVTIYLSEPTPSGAQWYKYDSINGWQADALRILSVFSDDRRSVTLLLEDGDYGDADGVRNGIIVDPGAIGLSYSSSGPRSSSEGEDADSAGGSGGGGGGCFISTTASVIDTLIP
jgi:hypothetical protein